MIHISIFEAYRNITRPTCIDPKACMLFSLIVLFKKLFLKDGSAYNAKSLTENSSGVFDDEGGGGLFNSFKIRVFKKSIFKSENNFKFVTHKLCLHCSV